MKKFAINSLMTGITTMTVFQKSQHHKYTRMRGFLRSIAAVLILLGSAASVFAQNIDRIFIDGQYNVHNEKDLEAALAHTNPNKTINLVMPSFGVQNLFDFEMKANDIVRLKLNDYNMMGADQFKFSGSGSTLIIQGSSLANNNGLLLEGKIDLYYEGTYISKGIDSIGKTSSDDIKVFLNTPGASWNSAKTLIIGDRGNGLFDINNGNTGFSNTLVIGNDSTTGIGVMNIYGIGERTIKNSAGEPRSEDQPTTWTNKTNTVVGHEGTGTLNMWGGSVLKTGNFIVGMGGLPPTVFDPNPANTTTAVGGTGTVTIDGTGGTLKHPTLLDIKGTSEDFGVNLTTVGTANMIVKNRAKVLLHYNDDIDNVTLRGNAHFVLGDGTTDFNNSYFMVDRGKILGNNGNGNAMTFTNGAMFEGSTSGFYKQDTNPASGYENIGEIELQSLTVKDSAVFSPGFGSSAIWEQDMRLQKNFFDSPDDLAVQDNLVWLYQLGKDARAFYPDGSLYKLDQYGNPLPVGRYGQINYDGDLILGKGGIMILDFDAEGSNSHQVAAQREQHKDFLNGTTVNFQPDSIVHFRPMTGYYEDNVEIQFAGGSTGDANAFLSLWPRRWFEKDSWNIDNGTLTMQREYDPFFKSAVSPNEKSVGKVLDWIYTEEWKVNSGKVMQGQKGDCQEQSDWFPVLDWFWAMNDKDFREAMRQLSGETRAASFYMPIRSPWRYGFERVNWRKRDNHVYFGQQNILAPYLAKQDVWVTPYWDYMHMSDDGNTSSAHTTRVSFMAGYDRALSKHTAAGFVFGYSQPKLQQVYSRVIADDYLFGAHYNTRVANDFELKLWGSYGVQHYRLSRNVPITPPSGESGDIWGRYKGNSVTASIQVSKPYSWGKGVIRPLAAIDYSFVKQSEAEEEGYDAIKLRYAASDWSQLFGRVGVRGDFGWKRVSLTGSVAYSYQMIGSAAPSATNQFVYGDRFGDNQTFDIQGPNLSRTFVNIGLGSQIYLNRLKSRMFFVQYNGNYGKRTNAQNASLGYQMTF